MHSRTQSGSALGPPCRAAHWPTRSPCLPPRAAVNKRHTTCCGPEKHLYPAHHIPHVTRHTPYATRHTSHATPHTSHVTRHMSHVTRHTSPMPLNQHGHTKCHNCRQDQTGTKNFSHIGERGVVPPRVARFEIITRSFKHLAQTLLA